MNRYDEWLEKRMMDIRLDDSPIRGRNETSFRGVHNNSRNDAIEEQITKGSQRMRKKSNPYALEGYDDDPAETMEVINNNNNDDGNDDDDDNNSDERRNNSADDNNDQSNNTNKNTKNLENSMMVQCKDKEDTACTVSRAMETNGLSSNVPELEIIPTEEAILNDSSPTFLTGELTFFSLGQN